LPIAPDLRFFCIIFVVRSVLGFIFVVSKEEKMSPMDQRKKNRACTVAASLDRTKWEANSSPFRENSHQPMLAGKKNHVYTVLY